MSVKLRAAIAILLMATGASAQSPAAGTAPADNQAPVVGNPRGNRPNSASAFDGCPFAKAVTIWESERTRNRRT